MNTENRSESLGAFSLPSNGIYNIIDVKASYSESAKIGVISAENRTFIPNILNLDGADITQINTYLPPIRDTHPTAVLSEIVGQRVMSNGKIFSGIVPNATAYIASVRTARGVYRAIEEMLSLGVKVINYSAGNERGEYSEFDREIDRLITRFDFIFVTAAGNEGELTSPGRSLNGITVGNLVTKEYPDILLSKPFSVWCENEDSCSAFSDSGVHKPDIVAPGAWIGYAVNENEIDYANFGTSYACPLVSGIAAAVYAIVGENASYLSVKAILLMSSTNAIVSQIDNPLIDNYIRLKSGYGVIQGDKAIEIANAAHITEGENEGVFEVQFTSLFAVFENVGGIIILDGEEYNSGKQNTLKIERHSQANLPMSVRSSGRFSVILI